MPCYHAQHTLHTDETLKIQILTPPLDPDREDIHFGWPNRESLLAGDLRPESFDRFIVGKIDGERAGSMVLHTPADTRDVGIVGFVHTVEAHRRKGVATILLETLIELFQEDNGQALYLCTENPMAHELYQKCGFRQQVGDGMQWLAPEAGDFEEVYFSTEQGEASIRSAHWGDLARCSALLNRPGNPNLIKHYQQNVYRDMRFESHFVHLKQQSEDAKGRMFVLATEGEHVVGLCTLMERDRYPEQNVTILDVVVAAEYEHRTSDLLNHAIDDARNTGWWDIIVSPTAGEDSPRADQLAEAGFRKRSVSSEYFKTKSGRHPLIWWTCRLPATETLRHGPGEYYGGRPSFLDD